MVSRVVMGQSVSLGCSYYEVIYQCQALRGVMGDKQRQQQNSVTAEQSALFRLLHHSVTRAAACRHATPQYSTFTRVSRELGGSLLKEGRCWPE